MIRIECTSGPHAGETRVPPPEMTPAALLHDLVEHDWEWRVDYSAATEDEKIKWAGAEIIARAVRAVQKGRVATFLGVEYKTLEELQAFEDAIVDSGYYVQLTRDDEEGVEVQIVHPE